MFDREDGRGEKAWDKSVELLAGNLELLGKISPSTSREHFIYSDALRLETMETTILLMSIKNYLAKWER